MPQLEATRGIKEAKGEYDFAVDGGTIGTITLRATVEDELGNEIPNGSVILGGYIEVDTLFTSAGGNAGTIAINSEGAGDLQVAAAVSGAPWSTTGRKSIVPVFTGASSVKTSAKRNLQFTIAVQNLTAGKGRVVVFYR